MSASKHSLNSGFREKLIEHLLIGELLKQSWRDGYCSLEIAKPEVDRSGFDVIAECNGIVRHIQLKGAFLGSKTARQKIHMALMDKPSGCVIWVYFDEDSLELGPFLFYGGKPGEPLPDLNSHKIARHTKGNAQGTKAERPNLRVVNKGEFEKLDSVDSLWTSLFG